MSVHTKPSSRMNEKAHKKVTDFQTFLKIGLILSVFASLHLFLGCQSVPSQPISEEKFRELSPFVLATDTGEEPLIQLEGNNLGTMLGMQYGAIGGFIGALATEISMNNMRSERIDHLGEAWIALTEVDSDQLFKETMIEASSMQPHPWIDKASILNDMDNNSMLEFASKSAKPTMGINTNIVFSGDLASCSFVGEYSVYWSSDGSGNIQKNTSGEVHHVIIPPQMGVELEAKAKVWQDKLENAETFTSDGFKNVAQLILRDLTTIERKGSNSNSPSIRLMGASGRVEDVWDDDRVLFRTLYTEKLVSIPIPEMVNHQSIKRIAILRSPEEERKDLSELLQRELDKAGFSTSIVDSIDEASEADAFLKIESNWHPVLFGWNLVGASISIIDPPSGRQIGHGSIDQSGPGLVDNPRKLLLKCWNQAFAKELSDELKRLGATKPQTLSQVR